MDFDFDTGTIYGGLATLDVTALPPLGAGPANILTIVGNGALTLPQGTSAERPAAAGGTDVAGMFRYNTTGNVLEYYNGTTWSSLSVGGGTVTSVGATSSTAALTISGSPITSSGSFTFDLDADLTAIAALSGTGFAVRTAADTWTTRTIAGTAGNVVVTDGDGIASGPVINLAAVTQATTGDFVKVTLDGFGRVTGNTAVIESDITGLVDDVYVNVSGDTMDSGADLTFVGGGEVLGLPSTPSGPTAATSKAYVDSLTEGLAIKPAVEVVVAASADITALGSFTYDNGTSGVGATITADTDVAFPTIDGFLVDTTTTGQNGVLIAVPGGELYNGRYNLTQVGDGSNPWILTRCSLCDESDEIAGSYTFVKFGTAYAGTGWVQTTPDPFVIGTDDIFVTQFSGAGSYTAGTGLTLTGTVFSLTSPVAVNLGGTGLTTAPSNGQLLVGNGSGYTLSTLTDGTAISITEGAGSITITNTGVTAIAGTSNQIDATASTGSVTLSLSSTLVVPGTINIPGLTANGALYVDSTGNLTSVALTDGQILIGDTGSVPVASTITGGTGVTVTNGAGTITIDVDNTELVTSFSAGTTGLTPSIPSFGDIVLAGTLNVANGGTGLTALGTANQVLGVDAAGTAAEYKTIAAGTGISVVPTSGVLTINNTGVTSVGLSITGPLYTISNSPVTTTGTLTATLDTQADNTFFAGPTTGGPLAPTFRTITAADLGTAVQLYKENPSTPTAPLATGTNAVAIGSGATASATNSFAEGAGSDARLYGMKAFANGSFATAGDAQQGMYVLRNQTTDNTVTPLFLDGSTIQLVLPNNSLFVFDILVAGRRTDAVGGGAGYRFVGVARKDATSGSITFVGTPSKTVIGETNNPWDSSIVVDTGTGAIVVNVRGENSKDINWVATVRTTEVTN